MSRLVCGVNTGWPVIRKCFKFHILAGQVPRSTSFLLTATLKHRKTSCEAKADAAMGFVLGCHDTFLLNESDKVARLQRLVWGPVFNKCLWLGEEQFLSVLECEFESVLWQLTNLVRREILKILKVKTKSNIIIILDIWFPIIWH